MPPMEKNENSIPPPVLAFPVEKRTLTLNE